MGYLKWRRARAEAALVGAEIVETSRGAIELKVLGDGPAVLVSHGALSGCDQAAWTVEHLGLHDFRVLAVSRPGYLRTPVASGPDWPAQADLFAALLDKLGVERAGIIGISAGGMAAVHFAARHPGRCSALVLWSAVTRPMRHESRMRFLALPVHAVWELAAWSVLPWAFARQARRRSWPNPQALADLIDCTTPSLGRRRGWRNDLRLFGTLDPTIFRGIDVPTLVLHGERDAIVPVAHARATAAEIPGAELEIYPGGTHVLAASHPENADRVSGFLARRLLSV